MIANTKEKNAGAHFTDRELVVLKLLPDMRDKQIATELSISGEGVRYHLRRIFAKLGAHDRRAAVQRARSIGLPAAGIVTLRSSAGQVTFRPEIRTLLCRVIFAQRRRYTKPLGRGKVSISSVGW